MSHYKHCMAVWSSIILQTANYTFANGACEACSNLISDDDLELVDEVENDDDTVAVIMNVVYIKLTMGA